MTHNVTFHPEAIDRALDLIETEFHDDIFDEVDVASFEDNSKMSGIDEEAMARSYNKAKIKFLATILNVAIDTDL